MSDLHDIRYLHDKNIPNDADVSDYDAGGMSIGKKIAIFGGIMAFLGLGTLLILKVTAGHATKPVETNLVQENTQKNVSPSPIPTIIETKIAGTVVCLDDASKPQTQTDCSRGLKTKSGETFALQNVQYDDIASGALRVGKKVEITGTTQTSSESFSGPKGNTQDSQNTIYVTTVSDPPLGTLPTDIPDSPTPTDVPPERD